MVEPAKEQNKRGLPMMVEGSFTKYITLSGGGGGGGKGRSLIMCHTLSDGGIG